MDSYASQIATAQDALRTEFEELTDKQKILRSTTLRALFDQIKTLPPEDRANFGKQVNELRQTVQSWLDSVNDQTDDRPVIDVTAPFDENCEVSKRPALLPTQLGSRHPLTTELRRVLDIFARMGLVAEETPQLDNEYYMFSSLNFPEGHPARDDYDTFITTEGLVAPAHASVMQNRLLKKYKSNLEKGIPISTVYAGRTFRNEDVDARHEHTFYQVEIMYVDTNITVGNLIATFKTFLEEYYQQAVEVKSQPFYFPFTEPSLELALSCPFCQKKGCHVCSQTGWIELLGMGLINPNVLAEAGLDSNKYTGFAGGLGLDRLIMMKYGIEDIRHLHSGKLRFLRQFA